MSEMGARYDRRSRTYARCWAPVLSAPALDLLDDVASACSRPGARLLDVGTGTGTIALAALARFPELRVTGLDLSAGMLGQARDAAAGLSAASRARLDLVEADITVAVGTSLGPAGFDAAVSLFVLQLVGDRHAALVAIRAALRPGGRLAFVVWADGRKPTGPEDAWESAFEGVLAESGAPRPDVPDPPRAGPIPTVDAALEELTAAGFAQARAERPDLVHDFGRAGVRALVLEYDHAAELEALPEALGAEVLRRFDEGLAQLPDGAFVWRTPLLRASAVRPT